MKSLVPGTVLPLEGQRGMFSLFRPMIQATGGLALNQICALTGLGASTVQNWIKRGFVARPEGKKYCERQLARILIISALRDSMQIERIGELMRLVNGKTEDLSDDIISEARLYDYLCEILEALAESGTDPDTVRCHIRETTADFSPGNRAEKRRLERALEVMVFATVATRYKTAANLAFELLLSSETEE